MSSDTKRVMHVRAEDADSGIVCMTVYDDGAVSLSRGGGHEDFVYMSPAILNILKTCIAKSETLTCITPSV